MSPQRSAPPSISNPAFLHDIDDHQQSDSQHPHPGPSWRGRLQPVRRRESSPAWTSASAVHRSRAHEAHSPAATGRRTARAGRWLDVPTAGIHTVMYSMREDGCEVDRFVLSKDEDFVAPTNSGPAVKLKSGVLPDFSAEAKTSAAADGLILLEAESASADGWELATSAPGFSGKGYLRWTKSGQGRKAGEGVLSYSVRITTPAITNSSGARRCLIRRTAPRRSIQMATIRGCASAAVRTCPASARSAASGARWRCSVIPRAGVGARTRIKARRIPPHRFAAPSNTASIASTFAAVQPDT